MFQLLLSIIYKRRKKYFRLFTLIAAGFVLIGFTLTLIGNLESNLDGYWVASFVGGEVWTSKQAGSFSWNSAIAHEKGIRDFLVTPGMVPQLRLGALITSPESERTRDALILGIDTSNVAFYQDLFLVEQGSMPEQDGYEIVLPESAVLDLGLEIGDQLVILAQTHEGYPIAKRFILSGSFVWRNSAPTIVGGDSFGYISISAAQDLVDMGPGYYTEIILPPLQDSELQNQARASLNSQLQHHDPLMLFSLSRIFKFAYGVLKWMLVVLIGLSVAVVVFHNVRLLILESWVEIGLYLSMGAKSHFVLLAVGLPIAIVALVAQLFGTLFLLLIVALFNTLNIVSINTATEIMLSGYQLILSVGTDKVLIVFLALSSLTAANIMVLYHRTLKNRPVISFWSR